MNNTIEDLSKVTTIPRVTLQKLIEQSEMCVCHDMLEQILNNENYICVDIMFGYLYINMDEDNVKFKFVPSAQFEDMIVDTINTKRSPLINAVESALSTKIMKVYKDLF